MLTHLTKSATHSLNQLLEVLHQTNNLQYATGLPILFGSSIGMHVRHITEFYQCFLTGVSTNSVNYDGRKRNLQLENDIEFSKELITSSIKQISHLKANDDLILLTSQDMSEEYFRIPTNVYRELTYLIEHSIHHMAIIKMAYTENFTDISFPQDFGVAYSTIKYKQACAQ